MTEKKKERMSFEEWRLLGRLTKTVRYGIMGLFSGYNKSSKEGRWLYSSLKNIEKVMDKLDNLVFEQHPEKTTDELCGVFYGSIEEKKEHSRA